jgi:hypothetical protein
LVWTPVIKRAPSISNEGREVSVNPTVLAAQVFWEKARFERFWRPAQAAVVEYAFRSHSIFSLQRSNGLFSQDNLMTRAIKRFIVTNVQIEVWRFQNESILLAQNERVRWYPLFGLSPECA